MKHQIDRTNNSLTESNKQLALANEQLKIHDKIQKDFINIASHELRTPIQPILSLSQIIRDRMSEKEEKKTQEKQKKNESRWNFANYRML